MSIARITIWKDGNHGNTRVLTSEIDNLNLFRFFRFQSTRQNVPTTPLFSFLSSAAPPKPFSASTFT